MTDEQGKRNRHEPNVRDVIKAIKKLRIQAGDTILLRRDAEIAKKEFIDDMVNAFERAGLDHVLIIVVDDFDDLTVLNEKGMAQHGWFRAEILRQIAHIKPEPDGTETE